VFSICINKSLPLQIFATRFRQILAFAFGD
jgi:hypothetical protein